MLTRIATATAFVLIVLLASTQAQQQPQRCPDSPPCISADHPPAPALSAPGGNGDYKFRHTADVNEISTGSGRKFLYQHCIRNLDPGRILEADWTAGTDTLIPFQPFDPCKCIPGSRESTIDFRENPDSIVAYGLSKQFQQKASAYTPRQAAQFSIKEQLPPELRSRFYLKATVNDKTLVADVTFVTSVRPGSQFVYSIRNNADADGLLFGIDALITRWQPFKTLSAAINRSNWIRASSPVPSTDLFFLKAGGPTELTVSSDAVSLAREEAADIRIVALATGREIGRATVSVYMPYRPS